METKEYLEAILEQESLKEKGPELNALREERTKVEKLISSAFEDCAPAIKYGGSKAKGTMVKSGYDLDLTIYFNHDDTECGETLKDIYENVQSALSDEYHTVPKNASIRLEVWDGDESKYTHIDIVPGRRVSEDSSNTDVFLYQNEGEKNRLKTNLDKHIDIIKESGVRREIKLAKIWKNKQGIDVKTFVLELMIVKILDGRKDESLEDNMQYLWTELRDNSDSITVEDPANPDGNDLTPLLEQSKYSLSSAASSALSLADVDMWSSIFGEVEEDDSKSSGNTAATASVAGIATRSFEPSSPYAE